MDNTEMTLTEEAAVAATETTSTTSTINSFSAAETMASFRGPSTPVSHNRCLCKVCARLPYQARRLIYSDDLLGKSDLLVLNLIDMGMFDIGFAASALEREREGESTSNKLSLEKGQKVAEFAKEAIKVLREDLDSAGLTVHNESEDGNSSEIRNCLWSTSKVVSPFNRSEVNTGHLLGAGGFSFVYDILSFQPDDEVSEQVGRVEKAGRLFMTEHAERRPPPATGSLRRLEDESQRDDLTVCTATVVSHTAATMDDPYETSKSKSMRTVATQPEKHPKKRGAGATPTRYALKQLRPGLADERRRFEEAAVDLVREGQMLAALDHPNIIKIHGWSHEGSDIYESGKYTDYFIVIDRLNETLEDRMWQWRKSLRKYRSRCALPWMRSKYEPKIDRVWVERIAAARDIAGALSYLHQHGVIYRDLKSSNIGFDVRGDLKIFDFGLATVVRDDEIDENGNYPLSRVGTKFYMAPEVYKKKNYNLSADTYSFGIVLWEILALSSPRFAYKKLKPPKDKLNHAGAWLPVCPCWPESIQNLMKACFSLDPLKRPSMEQVHSALETYLAGLDNVHQFASPRRRRSTYRLDLSALSVPPLELESAISQTSRCSSHLIMSSND